MLFVIFFLAILLLVGELLPFPMLRSVVSNSIETTDQGNNYCNKYHFKCVLNIIKLVIK